MNEAMLPGAAALAALRAELPARALRAATEADLEEPRGHHRGQALIVATPDTTEEVAQVVRIAGRTGQAILPYGGGTGLVGGQVMPSGTPPILLSLERMTAIRAVHREDSVLIAEAGAILADVQRAADDAGLYFPLSLASEGSCRIGGNLATNAGGVNVLRYGNARDLCLGLEAVMADGTIWHGLKRLRKDNTGYDLRNLLIGSEGTLGIITAAALRLHPRPAVRGAAIFVVPDPAAALRLLRIARNVAGEAVSAFELMSRQGLKFLAQTMPQVRVPFAEAPEWMVLVDLGLSDGADADGLLTAIFEAAMEDDTASDGVIAASEAQRAEFWAVRENIPEANRRIGAIASHDISLPLGDMPDFVAEGREAIAALGPFRINIFGHVGDGNLHYNIFPPEGRSNADFADRKAEIMRCVHDLAHAHDGSVSAEHGIGRLKVDDLERYGDPARLAAMRAIKTALDPKGILNPGVILRA